jgi:hypothetical protein
MKPRVPGSAHETLALMTEQIGEIAGADGVKTVADFEDIKPATVYKLLDPDQEGEFSYARVARIVGHFKINAPAHHMAQLAGGTFLPIPQGGDAKFNELTGAALAHLGQVTSEIIDAYSPKSDGGAAFTAREARHLLAPLSELLSDVSNLIAIARARADEESR